MPSPEAQMLLKRLDEILVDAEGYFTRALDLDLKEAHSYQLEGVEHYWRELPVDLQQVASRVAAKFIDLANDVAAAIRRSPLLSQGDLGQAGHAIKGMRAALRLRDYSYSDPEVLHDEGTVLGVRPASVGEWPADPTEAFAAFRRRAEELRAVLELVGAGVDEARVSIGSSGLSAPAGYRPGTAFIMMSMQPTHPELDDVADTVKRCFAKFGIEAVRADDIEHEDVITKKILDEIRTAEFLFADLSGERPSVYYEVSYAHALGRRVMLFRKAGTVIHFDLAAYNCPEYANLRALEDLLTRRLENVTGQAARAPQRIPAMNTRDIVYRT